MWGFQKWGYPKSWMVYNGQSHQEKMIRGYHHFHVSPYKDMDVEKSGIQLAERRKETTLQICSSPAIFLHLEKKETTLSFACS